MPDKVKITILDDGVIRVETDKISGPNHLSASQFLAELSRLAGGDVSITRKHGEMGHYHTHDHGQEEHQHH